MYDTNRGKLLSSSARYIRAVDTCYSPRENREEKEWKEISSSANDLQVQSTDTNIPVVHTRIELPYVRRAGHTIKRYGARSSSRIKVNM